EHSDVPQSSHCAIAGFPHRTVYPTVYSNWIWQEDGICRNASKGRDENRAKAWTPKSCVASELENVPICRRTMRAEKTEVKEVLWYGRELKRRDGNAFHHKTV